MTDAAGSWPAIQAATEVALIGAPDAARSAGSLASNRLRPAPEAVKVTPWRPAALSAADALRPPKTASTVDLAPRPGPSKLAMGSRGRPRLAAHVGGSRR